MTSPPRLPDFEARRVAATDFERNLVVEAGAGTGKTSLLVERLLVALGGARVRATEFAAITFTEKAAGELRERLAAGLERLRGLASGDDAAEGGKEADRALRHLVEERGIGREEIARRALSALADLDRARVGTIHSFCADLLRANPLEAGVDPAFEVDEGPVYETLLGEEWDRFVRRELSATAPRAGLWREVLARFSLAEIQDLARGAESHALADFAVPSHLLEAGPRSGDPAAHLRAEAARVAEAISSILARQRGMAPLMASILEAYRRAIGTAGREGVEAMKKHLSGEEFLRDRLRKSLPDPGKKLEHVEPAEVRRVASDARSLLRSLATVDEAIFREVVATLGPFALGSREALLKRGAIGFDGLLTLARDLLRDHPEVRERFRRSCRMLLVDEFQDTDPLQYEIVLFLSARAGAGGRDPFGVPLEAGRLFVVGDPKQSIYRFRGADYGAFRRAVARIEEEGGTRLTLVTNFRSRQGVIAPINSLFEPPLATSWTESPYQPRYVSIAPKRTEPAGPPRVEIWTVPVEGADARRKAEGRAVAAGIRRIAAEERRDWRDFFVLLRAFTPLAHYLRALREAEVPFVVDGGRDLLERTEVVQLLSAMRALARPADPVALLAFLRSPAGAVPDAELAAYGREGGRWHREEEPDCATFPTISRAFFLLRRLADETRELPADVVVRRVLSETGLMPLGAFAFEGAQRVANLRKLAAAASELARDGTLSLNQVVNALEEERAADMEGDSPLADEQTNAVRVLTIHKAKGLENKVVLVPDLARQEGHAGRGEGPQSVGVASFPDGTVALALRAGGAVNAARVWLDRDDKRHAAAEGLRMFYVAATRAAERLVLIAGPPHGGRAAWIDALRPWGYAIESPPPDGALLCGGLVLHRIAPTEIESAREAETPEAPSEEVEAYERLMARFEAEVRPPFARPSGIHEEMDALRDVAGGEAALTPPEAGRDLARASGSAVHRLLERWDGRDPRSLLGAVAAESSAVAVESDVDSAGVEAETRAILEAFLASPLAARFREATVLGKEVPLLLRDDAGTTWRGSVDLLYVSREGDTVVADYKTDRELGDDEAIARYAPQLAVYLEGVRKALGLPVAPRGEVWLLRAGRVVTVRPGRPAAEDRS